MKAPTELLGSGAVVCLSARAASFFRRRQPKRRLLTPRGSNAAPPLPRSISRRARQCLSRWNHPGANQGAARQRHHSDAGIRNRCA